MLQPATSPRCEPDDQPEKGSLPKLPEGTRQAKILEEAGKKAVADKTRGSEKDPRLGVIKGVQDDAAFVIEFSKADGAGAKLDLLTARINALGIDVTDPRYLAEQKRAQDMLQNPLSKEEIAKREKEFKASQTDSKAAATAFAEGRDLLKAGKNDEAEKKFKAGEALLETSLKALYPEKKDK